MAESFFVGDGQYFCQRVQGLVVTTMATITAITRSNALLECMLGVAELEVVAAAGLEIERHVG